MPAPDGCFACLRTTEGPHAGEPQLMRARIEPREAVATVGSGDAFLAGYVAARYGGSSAEDCLRFGVACGADSIRRLGAGLIEPREVDRLAPEVEVARVTEAAGV
jgi:sugar/nucleoside kinase (ribokinase family)